MDATREALEKLRKKRDIVAERWPPSPGRSLVLKAIDELIVEYAAKVRGNQIRDQQDG
jgi:hypothetical protein